MAKLSPEMEKLLLTMIPRVVGWLRMGKELTKSEIKVFRKLYPDIVQFAENATIEDFLEFNAKYQNHKIYGEHLKVFLTQEGVEYLEYLLELAEDD